MSSGNYQVAIDAPATIGHLRRLSLWGAMTKAAGRIFRVSGKKLAEARQAAYMNQRQLADAIGVSENNISKIEQSTARGMYLRQLPRLAAALKMTPEDVLTRLAPDGDGADFTPLLVPADVAAAAEEAAKRAGKPPAMWMIEQISAAAADVARSLTRPGGRRDRAAAMNPVQIERESKRRKSGDG